MGRKSRKRLQLNPFCFFCNREFDDEKVLIQHQKAKHFKCGECNRKLESANGLAVHMQQVHKMIQRNVPHAMEGRDDITAIVHGMYGVPVDIVEEHQRNHFKKMGDLDSKKQQRISWAIVTAAPTPELFLAQLSIGNIYFPGFTAMPENYVQHKRVAPIQIQTPPQLGVTMPPYGPDAGMQASGHHRSYGAAGSTRQTSQATGHGLHKSGYGSEEKRINQFAGSHVTPALQNPEDVGSSRGFGGISTGALILGPKGTPIEGSRAAVMMGGTVTQRPVGMASGGAASGGFGIASAPRGFSDAPATGSKSGGFSDAGGFSRSAGFSDPLHVVPIKAQSKSGGFSDAPGVQKPIPQRPVREESVPSVPIRREEPTVKDTGKFVQTQYYKASGVAPLFIPPPTLGTTKLAYDNDAVSIEEVRAKALFQWQDGL